MENAEQIGKVIGDSVEMKMWPGMPTDWLSSQALLYSRGSASTPWQLWKRDLQTGKDTYLKELSKQLRHHKVYPGFEQVSSDGQWVLCRSPAGLTFCSIQAKTVYEHPVGSSMPTRIRPNVPFSNPYGWMSDSQHWIELVQKEAGQISELLIHAVKAKEARTIVLLPPLSLPAKFFGCSTYPNMVTASSQLLVVTSHEKTFKVDYRSIGVMDAAELVRIDLTGEHAAPRSTSLSLPSNQYVLEAFLSPLGDQIVWLVQEKEASAEAAHGLWISNTKGEDWREIVHVERSGKNVFHGLQDIHWLPGGNQISFNYFYRFYTVDIPHS